MKQWLGFGLMLWGGAGVLNQFFLVQGSSGTQAPTAALNSFDPAVLLQISSPTPGFTSPAMLTDAAILAAGAYLKYGKL